MCVQDDDGEVDKLPDDTFLRVIESTLLSDLSLKGIPGIKKVNISFFLCLLSVFSFFVFFSLLHFFSFFLKVLFYWQLLSFVKCGLTGSCNTETFYRSMVVSFQEI